MVTTIGAGATRFSAISLSNVDFPGPFRLALAVEPGPTGLLPCSSGHGGKQFRFVSRRRRWNMSSLRAAGRPRPCTGAAPDHAAMFRWLPPAGDDRRVER